MIDGREPDSPADDTRWRRIRELFDEAAEREGPDRRAFLEGIDDADLRREVETLLQAIDEEGEFLETPAARLLADTTAPDSTENLTGERVGSYILLRLIGSGGMGVVYEAERADRQYRQRVAIKLMRRGVHSDMVLERFRRERQILASLDHPGIARLIDGGVSDGGRPYYVMEFIDGTPITEYCEKHRLGLRDRLGLFRDVCEAVHFAHRNLIVHRDLKPGNVLITAEGRVKLLDFGIAKLLSPGGPGEQTLTLVGGRMLTPAYASQEQVRGEQVTTASDVYSLGVVLYEILTGRKPFDTDTPSLEETGDRKVAVEPTRPSAAITDATRPQFAEGEGRRIRRTLEGELDNIVLMALRKDPERRYQSVAQLSEDIQRYLTGRPVVAQRDTAGYRVKKFVARHRSGAVALGVILLLLLGGLGATMIQARKADRARALAESRFDDVREMANALLFDVHDAISALPGATPARELIVTRGLEYLDRLAGQASDDPSLQHELASAYLQLGLVQGTPSGASLGQVSRAEISFERSLAIARRLVEEDAADDGARRTLALAYEKLGDVMAYRGAVEEGVAHARQALALWSYFAESQPDQESARLSAVISHVKLGDLLGNPNFNNLGDEDGAIGEYEYALNLLSASILAESENTGVIRYRALVHERLGSMLRLQGRQTEALEALEQALGLRSELASGENANLLRDVAVTHHQICGVHLSLGDFDKASSSCASMQELYRRLYDGDPLNAQAVRDLALGHEMLYRLDSSRGRWEEAAAALRRDIALREELLERTPDDLVNRRDRARALIRLCDAEARLRSDAPTDPCERGSAALRELEPSGITTDEDEALLRIATDRTG